MPSLFRLNVWSLTLAISATPSFAHPLFNGKIIERAAELLPAYDFVVVGGGAAGLTVANRLSEVPEATVLIIEAGDFDLDEDYTTIPGLAGGAVGTKYDWNTTYAPQPNLADRVVTIPQGKVVGGSTKLNRMVFDRGARSDFDGWAALGNKGWDFASMLPYYKKYETMSPPNSEITTEYPDLNYSPEFYGQSGPIQATFSPWFWPYTKNTVQAAKAMGIPINDQASGRAFGGYFCPHNLDPVEVTRQSAEEAYYSPASSRANYHILTGNAVTKIVTKRVKGAVKVTGVEFVASAKGRVRKVSVKKEAIVAAGALHSPQLLQHSGIGDATLLKSLNISTVVNLPAVGHNLHDHVSIVLVNTITAPFIQNSLTSNATQLAEARQQYDSERTGPLASPTADFLMFLPLSMMGNNSAAMAKQAAAGSPSVSLPADVPAEVAKGYAAQYALLNKKLLATDAAIIEVIVDHGVVILGLQHPYSRGSVKATSKSPFDNPVADLGLLRNPLDKALLREGISFARRFVKARGFAELQAVEIVPGGDVTSNEALDAFLEASTATLYHPAGTCKMGARAQGGVVDTQLKVYGVEGLRVVDSSVIPILPASHTMTTVYSVAEKAADIIKAAHYKTGGRRVSGGASGSTTGKGYGTGYPSTPYPSTPQRGSGGY
ncbi:uncharacterized protein L3040_007073 [Drepanopeziza brunnea f. sp. 'multigermtubi']|uniref:uncharacterized protein n=1 Tax=Drepanopeziza brunnea f. sp. 'multigermtubi' TaxID=698441 RepID=UPI00239EEB22|nr:hypothetical protein L3040_007073 [Drepanopeziza brunnea f. sp. 'multigermtubi']